MVALNERRRLSVVRERLALKIAPWLFVPYPERRDEAFKMLALAAYGSRDAIWTSPTTLARVALDKAWADGYTARDRA